MATLDQTEKAFQKQKGIFLGERRRIATKKLTTGRRFVKGVGLGFKVPREAREGTYVDKKCPFTGDVSIRGRVLTGVVKTTKMKHTIVVRRDYIHLVKKYHRFEKRHSNTPAHVSPCFRVNVGDRVTIGQCRPLSKTVRYNVLRVDREAMGSKKQFGGN